MPRHTSESLKLLELHIQSHQKLKANYEKQGDTLLASIHDNFIVSLQAALKDMLNENDTDMQEMAALHEAGVI